jgi:hypothetical protein
MVNKHEQTKTHYMMKIQVLAWDMLWDHNPSHLRKWISNGNAELEKGNTIKVCTDSLHLKKTFIYHLIY